MYKAEKVKPYQSGDKGLQVERMFNSIAHSYDLLNHSLSLGIDRRWRRKAIDALGKFAPQEVLDIATGTGDLAIMNAQRNHPRRIVGADIITFQREDCTHMSFADNSFDAVTSSYGVRNFSDLDAGLREMCRVLCPGGHLLIVELSTPVRFPMKQLFGIYAHVVMPLMGRLISHDDSAYTYLPMSMEAFPQAEEMEQILHKNGFSSVQWKRFCGGISTMYLATK